MRRRVWVYHSNERRRGAAERGLRAGGPGAFFPCVQIDNFSEYFRDPLVTFSLSPSSLCRHAQPQQQDFVEVNPKPEMREGAHFDTLVSRPDGTRVIVPLITTLSRVQPRPSPGRLHLPIFLTVPGDLQIEKGPSKHWPC